MGDKLGEYDSPLIYDAEYGSYQGDFDLFLDLIDHGKVLDLACGTGRLTIPLAQRGLQVTGIEISEPMLKRAQEKAAGLKIKWLLGDITHFDFDHKFDLITLAGNSFQALLTPDDQLNLFRCVKARLKPTGLFIFDTRNPSSQELQSTEDYEYWHEFNDFSGLTVRVFGKQAHDPANQIVTYLTKRIWPEHETNTIVKLRYTDLNELTKLLDMTGLRPLNVYGDYNKSEFVPSSKSIIVVCTSGE